jgi:hypothetical protein
MMLTGIPISNDDPDNVEAPTVHDRCYAVPGLLSLDEQRLRSINFAVLRSRRWLQIPRHGDPTPQS